jgi:hypothetical protein
VHFPRQTCIGKTSFLQTIYKNAELEAGSIMSNSGLHRPAVDIIASWFVGSKRPTAIAGARLIAGRLATREMTNVN